MPGLLRDPRELEQDARHVGRRRHRLGEPEDVGDRDRLGVVRRSAAARAVASRRCVAAICLGLELASASPCFGATSMNQNAAP